MSVGGFSRDRLGRMHDVMAGHVERGAAPGLVTLVSRRGEVHVDVIGTQAVGGSEPMRRDTIFRIASLTKPVTAVATMILVEECKLRLDEPVDRLLPELADRRVLTRLDAPIDDTVPANRPITVRDLLTFRMGFGYIMEPSDDYPIQQAMNELGLAIVPPPSTPPSVEAWMQALGSLPLLHQPGERWFYETGSDVLGVLIARAAGQPLEAFLRERIFEPLGMQDTAFSVPPAKLGRLPPCYQPSPETGALELFDERGGLWSRPPVFPSGSSGLVATIDDYLAFGMLLLNKGRHGSQRILSRPSVELMTTDQLTPAQRAAASMFLGENHGWGFGVAVVTRRDNLADMPGRFGWDGGYGTSWYADPSEELVAILMTQSLGYFEGIYPDFWTSVYQAIDD